MKQPIIALAALLAATGFSYSQEQVSEPAEPAPIFTTARILGNIPDGTPPPPAAPKPEFIVPAKDILQTATHQQGGRTITLHQIKPIALPPPPPPATAVAEPDPEFLARFAKYRETHPRSGTLFLSATVYRRAGSQPRTLVRYWPAGKGEGITFWSSADFALVSGIHAYIDTAGKTRSIFMGWGSVDIDRMTDLAATRDRKFVTPEIPTFPDGKASFLISGNQPAAEDLVAIQSLHDLYNGEYQRLLTAHQGREQARLLHEAELKANPPRPKDITLHYWRTEKPAPAKGGVQ
jgi:hypothetical protein